MPVFGDGLGQRLVLQPLSDVLSHHGGDQGRPAHAHGLEVRASHGEGLVDAGLVGKTARHGQIGNPDFPLPQLLGELVGEGLQVECRDSPLVHHRPGAHPGAARGAVDGEQIELRFRPVAHCHRQLHGGVGPRLESDPLEADLAKARHFLEKRGLAHESEAGMPLELLDLSFFVGPLHIRAGRVGSDDVAPVLKLQRPLQGTDLDLAADALGALTPLELDGVEAVLFEHVLGDAEAGVLHVHLDENLTVPFVIPLVGLDAPVHLGRKLDLPVLIEFELGVDAADVLAADQGHAGDGRPDGEVLPVIPGDVRRAEGAGEDRHLHFDFLLPPVLCLGVGVGENSRVRIALDALRQSPRPHGVAVDVEVRVVDGVVLVGAGRDLPEGAGVDDFATPEGGEPDFTSPLAAVKTVGAETRHRYDTAGPVESSCC